ncbi:MAG: hypothetical protein ABEH88_08170 [Halobacteriales archaeon]
MYGIVTRNAEELDWPEFDRGFYEVKDAAGQPNEPVPRGVNTLSCFGDTAAATGDPSLVPVSESGERATHERPYFDWSYVCPNRDAYREGLLETIEDCADRAPDVRLDDVGFPRMEYCHCEVCTGRFAASDVDDWGDWRAEVITRFVAEAADRIPGRTYLAVHPDPYPGRLRARSGIDLDAVAGDVDEIVVPLYDTAYETTYWLESLAAGFADRIERVKESLDLGIELYALNVDVEDLLRATDVADAYADAVYFGYESGTARAALRRRRAEQRDGESFG